MKKEIYCSNCGRKFVPTGREHICPTCKAATAAAAKRAAVERAKARSYAGEACPVRISAKSRGFIEAVANKNKMNFIHTLDAILYEVAHKYGFKSWEDVPEHRTARRKAQAAKVAAVTPTEAPATSNEQAAKVRKGEVTAAEAKAARASVRAVTAKAKVTSKKA